MSQRLFSVPKVGLFLDGYAPGLETRRGEEVKILTLTLRLQPFDAKLATSIDDGLQDDSGVKVALFKMSNGEPKPHLSRVNFTLGCPRQNLHIFATTDTVKSRITLMQAKIAGTYARTQKDQNGFAFVFKASVGPVGRSEQEFIHEWMLSQRFVTFEESEPSMEFDDGEVEEQEGVAPGRPAPMWDDGAETAAADAGEIDAARPTPKRGSRKQAKTNPETERAHQVSDAKRRPH